MASAYILTFLNINEVITTTVAIQSLRFGALVTGAFNKFILSRGILSKFRNKLREQSWSHLTSSRVITVAFTLMSLSSSRHFTAESKPYHGSVLAQTSIDNSFITWRAARTVFFWINNVLSGLEGYFVMMTPKISTNLWYKVFESVWLPFIIAPRTINFRLKLLLYWIISSSLS